MTDVRWIGRDGEKRFGLLCSQREVTCNKAEEDDRGWDFIIHFPASTMFKVPLDQRSVGPAALVQIKATRVDAQRWSISLKNALSLAKSPLPAFIVCVGLDDSGGETFRVVHIWRGEIVRILMAARQAHVDGEGTKRHSISFDLGNETARVDPLGWMLDEIVRIGENAYAKAKQLLVDTLGFEQGMGTARVRFSTTSQEAFADLQIGILKSLELEHFSYTPSRFGIEASSPEIQVDGGMLEVIPVGRRGTLRLRAPSGKQELLPAEVFSAVLPGHRRTKARVSAGCFEMIIKSNGRTSVKCTLDPDERTSLENIAAFALLRQARRGAPLTVSLKTDGTFVDFGRVNMKVTPEAGWEHLCSIAESLRRLVAFENAPSIETTITGINAEFIPLSFLDALVGSTTLRIEFVPVEEVKGTVDAFLAYTAVAFDGIEVGAVATRPILSDRMIGQRRCIEFGPAAILHASVNDGRAGEMRQHYLYELDRMSEFADVMAVGDLRNSVSEEHEGVLRVDEPSCTPQRLLAYAGDQQ